MIFSEMYGAYFSAVRAIIKAAQDHSVTSKEAYAIAREKAFSESAMTIVPELFGEKWQVLHKDGSTPLVNEPLQPVSDIEKRWLAAVMCDPRIRLFDFDAGGLEDVEPLYDESDVCVFDKYADGDPFDDGQYAENFRCIRDAIQNGYALKIITKDKSGGRYSLTALPDHLEYSEKDDKFRLYTSGYRYGRILNLARIVSVKKSDADVSTLQASKTEETRSLTLELSDERNTVERVMYHFAHLKKEAVREDGIVKVTVYYDKDDETEMLIRVLSFGPLVRVVSPKSFADRIKQRLVSQMRFSR